MHDPDRTRRVAELIRRALSQLIAREVADRRVRAASITEVTISRDLKQATVYFSCLARADCATQTTRGDISPPGENINTDMPPHSLYQAKCQDGSAGF